MVYYIEIDSILLQIRHNGYVDCEVEVITSLRAAALGYKSFPNILALCSCAASGTCGNLLPTLMSRDLETSGLGHKCIGQTNPHHVL